MSCGNRGRQSSATTFVTFASTEKVGAIDRGAGLSDRIRWSQETVNEVL